MCITCRRCSFHGNATLSLSLASNGKVGIWGMGKFASTRNHSQAITYHTLICELCMRLHSVHVWGCTRQGTQGCVRANPAPFSFSGPKDIPHLLVASRVLPHGLPAPGAHRQTAGPGPPGRCLLGSGPY